jgi:hypothetical protein
MAIPTVTHHAAGRLAANDKNQFVARIVCVSRVPSVSKPRTFGSKHHMFILRGKEKASGHGRAITPRPTSAKKPAHSPTTNPTTTPPYNRTTTVMYWGSAFFLDAAFDSLSTHAVSQQLRSLLSPLLMPWHPAVTPSKVIFIPGQKNWTVATALVRWFVRIKI